MASYQIPQFLDSGDKILLGMNLRQFGYALGFSLLSVLIYSLVNQASPGIGPYAIIPCAPLLAIGAYLSFGRFNGRDSEIYVLKYIINSTKPKSMVYRRQPVVDDLNDKLAALTYQQITKVWNSRISDQKAKEKNSFIDFSEQDSKEKIRKIQSLKKIVDENPLNALQTVLVKEQQLASTQQQINLNLQAKRNTPFRNNPVLQKPAQEFNYAKSYNPLPVEPVSDLPTQDATQENFFGPIT